MGGGRRPGSANHNPLSPFTSPCTPGSLGCNDAGDPHTLTLRGNTPGSLGVNDDAGLDVNRIVDPIDFDYLVRHRQLKSQLVESVQLSGLRLKDNVDKKDLWKDKNIWRVGGAIVFRVPALVEDVDGSERAYHPPTATSWDGRMHGGPAKDNLPNAVSDPPYRKVEKDWPLTAGCQLFRDLHKAKGLEAKAASHPAAAKPPDQASADKAAKETQAAKDALDEILKKYKITKLSELEEKSESAVCVLYIDGRPIADSQADWSHVNVWAGIQTDDPLDKGTGTPLVRTSGPNKGFYIPRITPAWADADKHPWVVLNPPQGHFGVNLTNSAVVIKNGESPTIAYGMVGDSGPHGHLGEVSRKMMDDLNLPANPPDGDYIIIQFPANVSKADIAKEKQLAAIRSAAQAAFEAWSWEGRSGMDLIKELFPTPDQYHRVQNDFAHAKQYLNTYIDQLMLKL